MKRHLTPRALKRADWFRDLNIALAEAQKLLAMLEADSRFSAETRRLRERVMNVRAELDALNRVMLGEGRVVGQSWPQQAPTQAAES